MATSGEFRTGLAVRGLSYVVGVQADTMVFAEPPVRTRPTRSPRGRPPSRRVLAAGSPQPVAVGDLGKQLRLRRVSWRPGTKGWLSGRFAWVQVWPAAEWHLGVRVRPAPQWLLVEEQPGGEIKYALSNLPPTTPLGHAVRPWKNRWQVEQGLTAASFPRASPQWRRLHPASYSGSR